MRKKDFDRLLESVREAKKMMDDKKRNKLLKAAAASLEAKLKHYKWFIFIVLRMTIKESTFIVYVEGQPPKGAIPAIWHGIRTVTAVTNTVGRGRRK